MKRIITLVVILLAVGAVLSAAAEKAETFACGDFEYTLAEDGSAVITDYKGEEAELTVPAELDGHTVKEIGDRAFYWCSNLTTITLPDSLTSIGDEAFWCSNLTTITLPDSLTSIGDSAFYDCNSLTSITLPDSITDLGANPWRYCKKLKTIKVSPEHPALDVIDGVLYSKADKRLVWYPMYRWESSFEVPQGIQIIGEYAFCDCDSLTSITLPDSITSIGNYAFYLCDSLTSITLPDSITDLGANPWVYCENLATIKVSPEHPALDVIDGVLYSKADKLLVWYPMTRTESSFEVPQGIRIIGDSAFYWCDRLTSITLPDSLTSIGDYAFYLCESLTSITLPDSVTSIGDEAFAMCESLTSITLPDSITSIGNYAFYWCDRLTSITLPDSVTSIGDEAFAGCDRLTKITLPDSLTSIGNSAFFGCEILTILVTEGSYAEQYCIDEHLTYNYTNYLDWLND